MEYYNDLPGKKPPPPPPLVHPAKVAKDWLKRESNLIDFSSDFDGGNSVLKGGKDPFDMSE